MTLPPQNAGVSDDGRRAQPKVRMTGKERREQLLDVGRQLFAERGFDGTSVEEIAARAGVSKPVVYEHFGGKEGLYAVVVDREVGRMLDMVTNALTGDDPRLLLQQATLAMLTYVEDQADGFRILVRESPVGMVALSGQWWLDQRRPKRDEVAAHLVNLAWNGLSQLEHKPKLHTR